MTDLTLNKLINIDYIQSKSGLSKIALYENKSFCNIVDFVKDHRDAIQKEVLRTGGVIFRNFNVKSTSEFSRLSHTMFPKLLEYINRSTPRKILGSKIYTTTEYPAFKDIPLHNENSYTNSWPEMILFGCLVAAKHGGETPVVDSRYVLQNLDREIVKKFTDKKIKYVRNYISGIDLSWQEVFQTDDKHMVEDYCKRNNINYEWNTSAGSPLEFTTFQTCQAVHKHHITNESVWFNQAHLFHSSSLDKEDKNTLLKEVGSNLLPRNVYYADDNEILIDELSHIREVYDLEKIIFSWQSGDVMLLDNVLMAHGRLKFNGYRKVIISMGQYQ